MMESIRSAKSTTKQAAKKAAAEEGAAADWPREGQQCVSCGFVPRFKATIQARNK